MKQLAVALLGLLLLAGCGGSSSTTTNYQRPLASNQWAIFFSPSAPATMLDDANGQPYFDFPATPGATGGVHYVVEPASVLTAGQTITMTFELTGTGTLGQNDPSDTGSPTLRLFLWEKGDDLSGAGPFAWFRWWSNPVAVQLVSPGNYTVTVPLTSDQWSSVLGLEGNSSTTATVGFNQALGNLYGVGFSFGGEFAGHGNYVKSGNIRFTLKSFTVQ